MQEEEGPHFLLNRERLLRQWQWRFISLLGYCHKKLVVSGLCEAPLGSNLYQGWSHRESMPSLFPILSWRIPGGWTPTKSQRQRNPLMRTTWASPEGGELGEEDVEGQKEQAWLSREGEVGLISQQCSLMGTKKGLHLLCPFCCLGKQILLLFIFPTEDKDSGRVLLRDKPWSSLHPSLRRGIRSHMLKITTRLHPQTSLGLSRSECMGRKNSRFLFELNVFKIQATLLCMSFLETKGSWKIRK